MKINPKTKIREVAGEHIAMRVGDGKMADMTSVVAFNESSLLLIERLHDCDFELDDVVRVLTDEYEIDNATARRDAERWLEQMKANDIITR